MKASHFSDLLLIRDYKKVQQALDKGFDPNTALGKDKTALEWCSYSDDYRMMEILWKAGAKPTTPLTKQIVKKFEKGKTWNTFSGKKSTDAQEGLDDLTNSFSVKKLQFAEGKMKKIKNGYTISLPVSPFILDKKTIKTSIRLQGIEINDTLKKVIGKTISFPVNPKPGYIDGSMLIRGSHVPVDVTKLKIKKWDKEKLHIDLVADFLFEHEEVGFKNEKLKIGAIVTFAHK